MEGGDSTLVDQSSNSHNGTINGATRSSDIPGNITNTSISNTTTKVYFPTCKQLDLRYKD